MMMRAAGGPGPVAPLDYNERRPRGLSRTAWGAIGAVAAAHVALGVGLYYFKVEMTLRPTDDGPPIIVDMIRPKEPELPKPVVQPETPTAPPNVARKTTAPTRPVETINAAPTDTHVDTITISTATVADPVPDAAPAEPIMVEAPRPPRTITNPAWASRPNAAQMTRAYPDRAMQRGLAGTVTLNCLVQSSGSVTDCNVVGQTEPGQGFDRAAQSLTRYFRVTPMTVDGAAQGSRVTFNLRFVPPAD